MNPLLALFTQKDNGLLINPFDTMKFQYFALISTGMKGTHVHLPIMTLIYDLKLNNRHGLMDLWCEFTADYLDPIYNFLP